MSLLSCPNRFGSRDIEMSGEWTSLFNSEDGTMHYMLAFYQGPEGFAARADPEKRAEFWRSFGPYVKALQDAGIVVAGAGLEPPETATSVRPTRDGGHRVQDGPFADSTELFSASDWSLR